MNPTKTTAKANNRLRLIVTFGEGEPRVFDVMAVAPLPDVQRAITAAACAFDDAIAKSLEASRAAHAATSAQRSARRLKPTVRA